MKFKINFLITGLVLSYLPEFLSINENLDHNAKVVLSMTILMIFLWLTETLPNSVTAFIPIIVSPFLFDIELKQILYKYSSPVVFLLLGGFILALGFEFTFRQNRSIMMQEFNQKIYDPLLKKFTEKNYEIYQQLLNLK